MPVRAKCFLSARLNVRLCVSMPAGHLSIWLSACTCVCLAVFLYVCHNVWYNARDPICKTFSNVLMESRDGMQLEH